MDGEAGWWTTSGNIGLPPLARVMGVCRQQQQLKCDMCEYEVIKGYHVDNDEIEKETIRYLRVMLNSRHVYERLRNYG